LGGGNRGELTATGRTDKQVPDITRTGAAQESAWGKEAERKKRENSSQPKTLKLLNLAHLSEVPRRKGMTPGPRGSLPLVLRLGAHERES